MGEKFYLHQDVRILSGQAIIIFFKCFKCDDGGREVPKTIL
jgi:hypothetical protein